MIVLLGVGLVAANALCAFGIATLTYWLYFTVGWKWTPDAVVPQIQAYVALGAQCIAALVFVPAGLAVRNISRHGWLVALTWPPAFGIAAHFNLVGLLAWLALTIAGIALLMQRDRISAS